MNGYHTFNWIPLTILLVIIALFGSGDTFLHAANYNINKVSQAYILDKFEDRNLVLLGTRHKKQQVLKLISGLIPNLHDVGVTHL